MRHNILLCALLFSAFQAYAGMSIDCQGTLAAWRSDPSMVQYLKTHSCSCTSSSGAPVCTPIGTGSGGKKGLSQQNQLKVDIIGAVFQSIFNDILNPPDHTAELKQYQQEQQIKKAQETQLKKQQLQKWMETKDEAIRKLADEQAKKIERGGQILAQVSVAEDDMTIRSIEVPLSMNTFNTKQFGEQERMICTSYFMKLAESAAKDNRSELSSFYSGEAEKVMRGEPTETKCEIPDEVKQLIGKDDKPKKDGEKQKMYMDIIKKVDTLTELSHRLDVLSQERDQMQTGVYALKTNIKNSKGDTQEMQKALDSLTGSMSKKDAEIASLTQEKDKLEKEIETFRKKLKE